MSIVVRYKPIGLTKEKYDASLRQLTESGAFPPDGLDYHVCFGSDGSLNVSDIWDSPEQLAAFGEIMMPVVTAAGIEFSGEPDVFEVHNSFKR